MTTLKTTVALLLTATGLLAIYAVSRPRGIGKRDETIASAREPAPLLGVVLPRPGIISH